VSWPLVKLKDCCQVVGGATPKRNINEYWSSDDVPWVTPKDISKLKSPILEDTPEYISHEGFKRCAAFMLPKGSILVTSRAPIGNIAITGRNMCTNQGFKSLIPGDTVHGNYLYYCMLAFSKKLQALGNGATFKEVSKKTVEEFKIPLPPLDEQKRIAAILDKADVIRRKRQQAIQLADDFLRSVFLGMFGDPLANPNGWNVEALGKLTTKITDGKHGDCSDEKDSGYYFISAKDVNHGIVNYQNSRQINKKEFDEVHRRTDLKSGDIVMVNTGATIGRVAIVRDDKRNNRTTFQKSVAIIKLDKQALNPTFLKFVFLLRIKDFASVGSGSAIKNLLLSKMREFPIIVPPLELQKDFEKIVLKIEQSSINKEECTVSTLELFNSLSQKAFAGEL